MEAPRTGLSGSGPLPFGTDWDGGRPCAEEPERKKLPPRDARVGAGVGEGASALGRGLSGMAGAEGAGTALCFSLLLLLRASLGRGEGAGSSLMGSTVPFLNAFLQSSWDSATSVTGKAEEGKRKNR